MPLIPSMALQTPPAAPKVGNSGGGGLLGGMMGGTGTMGGAAPRTATIGGGGMPPRTAQVRTPGEAALSQGLPHYSNRMR
jgi:hypothetical protein